jgi:sugar phosphate isomerase/epimerase
MRYAICNETFEGWEHPRVCDFIAGLGYSGLEIAPFTLAPLITDVTAEQLSKLRREAEAAGVQIIGLHWLLAKTTGFHLTSPDAAVRKKTGDYIGELARAAADLGGDVLVLGSPAQRKIPKGYTYQEAEDFAVQTLEGMLPVLDETGVRVCVEPLTPNETDFMLTAAQAVRVIDRLAHPNVKLLLDVKAMAAEAEPRPALIAANAKHLYHFHANDDNLRGPGFGAVDFKPILKALHDAEYTGWVSVEVFDYSPDPETIARESIRYLKECEA